MHRSFAPLAALPVLVVGLFAPGLALAESGRAPLRCEARLLPAASTVPANLPAFVIDATTTNGTTVVVQVVQPADGGSTVEVEQIEDPRTPGVKLLVPSSREALTVGRTYSLPYTVSCPGLGGSPQQGTATFTATAPVALPTSVGSVRELADGTAVVTPSVELAAYLETARFEMTVDGVSAGLTSYGAVLGGGGDLEIGVVSGSVRIKSAYALGSSWQACPTGSTGVVKHEAKLLAHVAGAESDPPPLAFALSVDCSKQGPGSLPDAGDEDRGASGDTTADSGSAEGGGCSVGGAGSLGGLAGTFGVGAALAALLRRRRSKRA